MTRNKIEKHKILWRLSGITKEGILKICSEPGGGVMTGLDLVLCIKHDNGNVTFKLKTIYINMQSNIGLTEIGCRVMNVLSDVSLELGNRLLRSIATIQFSSDGDFVIITD